MYSCEKKFTQAKLEKAFQCTKWSLLHRTAVLTRGARTFLRRAGSGLECARDSMGLAEQIGMGACHG